MLTFLHPYSSSVWLNVILHLVLYLTTATGTILFEARETSLCSYMMDETTGMLADANCFLEGLTFTVGVDVDVRDRTLFFSDINDGTIRRVSIADGAQPVEQVFHGLGSVEDIAVDWLSQNLYWTDFVLGHICASRYDGTRRTILVSEQNGPRSIAVWPSKGLMFWTNVGDTLTAGNIMRADLSGNDERVLVGSGLSSPNGLTLDFSNNRLYFADRGTEMIESVRIGGGQREQLYQADMADFFDMTILGGFLYTTRWSGNDPNGFVTAVEYPIDDFPSSSSFSPQVVEIDQHTGRAFGITTFDEDRQNINANKPMGDCGVDNGLCDHLCMPIPGNDFQCECATGYTLDTDGKTCNTDEVDKDFLLFADSSLSTIFQGYKEVVNNDDYSITAVDLEGLSFPVDLAFDPVDGVVYWTDRENKNVNRAGLNGTSNHEVVAGLNVQDPSGIDLDVLRRLVYWVDEDLKTINVINMDLTDQRVVIDQDLDEPRALAVDPLTSEIFWTDWGQTAKIEKAKTSGFGRQIIVTSGLGWPNGLTIDVQGEELYWCDALNDIIEKSDLSGNGRRVVAYLEDTAHPFGLAISSTHIYWSDWTTRNVYTMTKSGGDQQALTTEGLFLRLQGMCSSEVSYPLDAILPTTLPATNPSITTNSPGDSDPLSSDTIIIIAAAAGGGLALLVIIIIVALCCCKCKRNSKESHHRAPESYGMDNMNAPPPYPGMSVELTPESKHKSRENPHAEKGDHIYEDLDAFSKMTYDQDAYLNPAFLKGDQSGGEYTGLKSQQPPDGNGYYLDMTRMPPLEDGSAGGEYLGLYVDPQSSPQYGGDPYMDLQSDPSQQRPRPPSSPRPPSAKTSVSSLYPPQYQSSGSPRPPSSPRPSQTSHWAPEPKYSPRISATRPPPSPRISATKPPSRHQLQGDNDYYMESLGPAPRPPGAGMYESTMNNI